MTGLYIVLGFAFLIAGAEFLVRGASRLARLVGLSPLVIGLTVVAYGTSAPEFAVSIKAGLAGQADIALGNVVGSNTFNVLFILGVSALILPLAISRQLVRLDVPVMIAVSVATWVLALDGSVSRAEGIVLVAGIVGYTLLLIRIGQKNHSIENTSIESFQPVAHRRGIVTAVELVIVGLVLLVLGARWLVTGASNLASLLGVSELLIGLTVVAAGTSLPEAVTSIVAAIHKERDIAVGNIVGSNIFNILGVLGASAAVSGRVDVAPAALHFDIPVMTAVALVCLPIFFTGGRISRWEGALFIAYYAAYVTYLVLKTSQHNALPAFNWVVFYFALPATSLGIGLSLLYAIRSKRVLHDPGDN